MQPEQTHPGSFVEDTIVIDWQSPRVIECARSHTRGVSGDVAQARALYLFVRDEIAHTGDVGGEVVTCRASEVLRERTGVGFAKSHLLAALLRSEGIPAGFCYQVLHRPGEPGRTLLYGYSAVHLASLERWVQLDARGNREGLAAEFSTGEARLAVAADPEAGEFVYPTIFARPAKVVVDLLERREELGELARHIPERLPDVPDPQRIGKGSEFSSP